MDVFTTSLYVRSKRTSFPKTVIYVRAYSNCCGVYTLPKHKVLDLLNRQATLICLLVDMFTAILTTERKEEALESLSMNDGKLCLVITTTAFGMGIDFRRVIHWGYPAPVQETG